MAAPWRFLPCSSCCGGVCDNCDGPIPTQYQVVLSNFQAGLFGLCGDCLDLNDTFVLDGVLGAPVNPISLGGGVEGCLWHYEPDPPICSVELLELSLGHLFGTTYVFRLVLHAPSPPLGCFYANDWLAYFDWNFVGKPPCATLSSETHDVRGCHWCECQCSSAAATLTAL